MLFFNTADKRFRSSKETVHAALSDNFNSRAAVSSLTELINDLNKEFKVASISSTSAILLDITKWITRILATFGFDPSTTKGRLGWAEPRDPLLSEIRQAVRYRDTVRGKSRSESAIDEMDTLSRQLDNLLHSKYPELAPYLEGISDFATSIANLTKAKAPFADFLRECDRFRDETMLELGVSIDDTDFGIATIRFADASSLVAERDRKRAAESALAQQKAIEKLKRKEEEERRVQEKLAKGKLQPAEMFRTSEYSQWDEEVLPFYYVLTC
jgi:cysteinyl-tRNA synthetase